jgi:hypothetical protein
MRIVTSAASAEAEPMASKPVSPISKSFGFGIDPVLVMVSLPVGRHRRRLPDCFPAV